MSAASEPAPVDIDPSMIRYSTFLPMLVLLVGLGAFAGFHMFDLEEQLDEATQKVDHLDGSVRAAEWEKNKFLLLTKAVLALAPTDPNAAKIVDEFHLKKVPRTLLDGATAPAPAATNAGLAPAAAVPTSAAEEITPPANGTNAPFNPEPPKLP